MRSPDAIAFIDSHTEGEPTRVAYDGLPELGRGPVAERMRRMVTDFPGLRGAIVDEPRGYPALVGALLLPPHDPSRAAAAVLYVNNVGLLPMCVHASVGVARTLVHLGRAPEGAWERPLILETLAGEVAIHIDARELVTVENVPSHRYRSQLTFETRAGVVRGDLAWGGNWFLIVEDSPLAVEAGNIPALTQLCLELRAAMEARAITGAGGAAIDHVQLCGPSEIADARNFVLCPGGEYDRSACGTGTSARMACLHGDGRLEPGQTWVQEGITGSCFEGSIEVLGRPLPLGGGESTLQAVRPRVHGRAWVTAEGRLLFDSRDERAPSRAAPSGNESGELGEGQARRKRAAP